MELNGHTLVLFADNSLLVVNKPAGLPALPDGYRPDAPYLRSVLEPIYGRLWMVHRLDWDTSGAIVMARSPQAHRALNTQFQEHQTGKVYHALVSGSPGWDEQRVDAPLLADGDRRHRSIVEAKRGKVALTELYLLERFDGYVLVEARPKTGRTRQIRAHLAHLGYPILVGALYGKAEEHILLGRLGLHAWSLAFVHPWSGEQVSFNAAYPQDFEAALQQLRKIRLV